MCHLGGDGAGTPWVHVSSLHTVYVGSCMRAMGVHRLGKSCIHFWYEGFPALAALRGRSMTVAVGVRVWYADQAAHLTAFSREGSS